MEVITENNEHFTDFADMMEEIERIIDSCKNEGYIYLANKWQNIYKAFDTLTEEDILVTKKFTE